MRPARARIVLDALRHNYLLARARHGGRALAVIKANAYGHGAIACAKALSGVADGFAVAFLDEALSLRAAGIQHPILLLEGVFDTDELDVVMREQLWIVVHHAAQIDMIERTPASQPLHVWLKINTGMNRAGFLPEQAPAAWQRLHDSGRVASCTLMTHFARADEPDVLSTTDQIAVFDDATRHLPGPRSLANSSAVLGWQAAHRDWARPGILLYGADPLPAADNGLRPVMTLQTRLIAIKHLRQGDALGYGGTWVCPEDMAVGVAGIGYGDGYPRHAPSGTPVLIAGRRAPLVGRVSMDLISIDLRGLSEVKLGDTVTLWGEGLPVDEIAARAGTISYELLCRVTPRVPRRHLGARS